jgi:predicted Zn-dependent protease
LAFKLSTLAFAACLGAAILSMPGGAPHAQTTQRLPALGEAESDELGIGDERRMGDQIMREIRRDPDVLDDPVLTEYLDSIFMPLLAAARSRGDVSPEEDAVFAWEPFLVRDRTFNAFALPGGFIGVHLGLIAATGSDDELASVLGHELSHITQRHIARSMANSRRQTLAATLGMVLGLLAASRTNNSDIPMAILAGSQAAAATGQLTFSREMEREADRFGLDVMSTAGFSPAGMAGMFERLEGVTRLNDSNQYPYLRSHPLTIERLAEARLRANGPQPTVTRRDRPVEHQLMRTRARVLMDPTEGALRRLQEQGRQVSGLRVADRMGALYGAALASVILRDFATADVMLEAALVAMTASPTPAGPTLAAASQRPAAPASEASDAAHAPVVAAGLSLAESASTDPAPPVDLAGPAVRRDFALLRLQLAVARRGGLAELATASAALERDATRPTMIALGESAVVRVVVHDPAAPEALHREIERLQTWVSEHRNDAVAWATLAQCADAAGLKLRAIRAEAEAHASQGDLIGAIDRLHAGQRLTRGPSTDFVEASIIDTRLRELEAVRRELMKDDKELR